MALVLVDVGADALLARALNKTFPTSDNTSLKLFTNNVTPVDTHTAANYTEASGGGYSAKTLTAGSWTVSSSNDPSDAVYAEQTFTFTGALDGSATVYGYTIHDGAGTLLWAELLPTPFQPTTNGDTIKITPKLQLSKGTPS